jgi:predicted glycoside hydrolase/deacetylase ChbG (UPF0249 family)
MNEQHNLSQNLGYPKDTRLLIIHADDAGLSHAENKATIKGLEKGSVNSYSIMVPCPWFYQMAVFAKENPSYDYGIHLTLTCEWQSYKFGPVLSAKEVPSLVDKNGFFFKSRKELIDYADPEEVKLELCAQIDKAIHLGLKPSHLDSHMYSLGASEALFKVYHELGEHYSLPIMLNKQLTEEMSGLKDLFFNSEINAVVDHIHLGNFEAFKNGRLSDFYENSLKNLQPGFNIMLIHTAYNSSEMRSITENHPNFGAAWRQIDLDFFTSKRCKDILIENQIQMITWSDIKSLYYS